MVAISQVDELRSGELQISARLEAKCVHLAWQGRSAARDPRAFLVPYFEQAFAVARDHGGTVEMHFEDLSYFNSSTITALIDGIRLATERGVAVVMVYKQGVRWQRMSFDALRSLTHEHRFELRAV